MKRQAIVSMIAGAIGAGVVLVAAAADDAGSPWPRVTGAAVVQEWYTDIPWRQKLGTQNGNKIDIAIVLPYDVLRPNAKKACEEAKLKDPTFTEERCMIEIGVTNIVGTLRTDTLYDKADPKIAKAKYCSDGELPCIEVKLQVSNWWAQPATTTLTPGVNTLNKQLFGIETEPPVSGFVLTDATVYAPQMPWYMSHYCDSRWNGDSLDPVCYGDYFSTMNSAFNGNFSTSPWPANSGFSVYPSGTAKNNHCKDGLDNCSIALAAFDRAAVPSDMSTLQYQPWNGYLKDWFNRALAAFPDQVTAAERERHFAWITKSVGWEDFLYPQAVSNPFQGVFEPTKRPDKHCDVTFDGNNGCGNTGEQYAKEFVYPRRCSLKDLAGAANGDGTKVENLRKCSLAYETHPNGFIWQWSDPNGEPGDDNDHTQEFKDAKMPGNQYGRTSFLFAGVPGMQLPVTFLKDDESGSKLSIYERVYNASIFSMYLPIANVADNKNAVQERNYTATQFYHTLLMSNHNESDPWQFADGVRGKVLWHNEYRMEGMYKTSRFSPSEGVFRDRMFAASFKPAQAKAPWHNETCDGCHVRNGSGIPINTENMLDAALREFMRDAPYSASVIEQDYTFTGKIRPMKLVFFDLRRDTRGLDASRYSEPLSPSMPLVPLTRPGATQETTLFYNNKVMNYHGDSFHVTTPGNSYTWTYKEVVCDQDVTKNVECDRMVVKVPRTNAELKKTYSPRVIALGAFQTAPTCAVYLPAPAGAPWPATDCSDVNGDAITAAIARREVGYMHLNGKRLGNLSAIEAIPTSAIVGFQDAQKQNAKLGKAKAGEIVWNAGTRDGMGGTVRANCQSGSPDSCYPGRFGWIGDRASLEDQVANAAFVEMNLTTRQGFEKWNALPVKNASFPIRYGLPNCGPADKACRESKGNGDLTERDVERMADYARWVGSPTRSEFQVALKEVIEGERVFRDVGCDTCHVIRRIDIIPDQTMLSKGFRDRLDARSKAASGTKAVPFLSYIGTDLLMHDMGYLSQVAAAPTDARNPSQKVDIRNADGTIKAEYFNYMQKIRTPPLKGLGFNRFATDSYRNTKAWVNDNSTMDAACDFLLHDGRACDAVEAAFLHDGPAVKALGIIEELNKLSPTKVQQLRAFLYSL